MKSYLKLVDFELGRFIKIYLVLAGLVIISQLVGVVQESRSYMEQFNDATYQGGMTIEQFIENYALMDFQRVFNSPWFNLPIIFAAAALIFYCFFIWYRDWFGKNTFIYRLLMLPTARINILLSKATAIFLMVLGLVALQVILLVVEKGIMKSIVPANLRTDLLILEEINSMYGNVHLGLLIPQHFLDFIIHYSIGFMAVFILFTAILFERSFRFKGILYGAVYSMISIGIFISPSISVVIYGKDFLYPEESFILNAILWLFVTGLSIWISNYLLNKKITV